MTEHEQDQLYAEIGKVFRELMVHGDDADRVEVIAALANHLGNAIAHACNGNPRLINEMFEGTSQHVLEIAVQRARLYQFLGAFKQEG